LTLVKYFYWLVSKAIPTNLLSISWIVYNFVMCFSVGPLSFDVVVWLICACLFSLKELRWPTAHGRHHRRGRSKSWSSFFTHVLQTCDVIRGMACGVCNLFMSQNNVYTLVISDCAFQSSAINWRRFIDSNVVWTNWLIEDWWRLLWYVILTRNYVPRWLSSNAINQQGTINWVVLRVAAFAQTIMTSWKHSGSDGVFNSVTRIATLTVSFIVCDQHARRRRCRLTGKWFA